MVFRMRGLLAAALCVGCASGVDAGDDSALSGDGGAVGVASGGDTVTDSGGSPGNGGSVLTSGGSNSGGSAAGGSTQETGGEGGSGGLVETGGSGDGGNPASGGDGSGGSSSGGAPTGDGGSDGSGGSAPVVVWSGSYDGDSLAANGDEFLLARLYLDYPDCSVNLGIAFEPGDSGTFSPESTYDLSCANPEKLPVAQFGPMEWDMPPLPREFTSEELVRLVLTTFDASPWPANASTELYLTFEWEILGEDF